MALVSQFVNAGDLRAARSAGIRDQGVLFQLGRELRDLDQQFQFNQQANPLRLSQLQQDLINSREANRTQVLNNDFDQATFDTRVDFTGLGTELRRDEATVSRATVPDQIEQSRQTTTQAQQATQSQQLALFQQQQTLPSAIQAQVANNNAAIAQIEAGRQALAQEGINVDQILPLSLTQLIESQNEFLQQIAPPQGTTNAKPPAAQPASSTPTGGTPAFQQAFNPLIQGDPLGAALNEASASFTSSASTNPARPRSPSGTVALDSFGNPLGTAVPRANTPLGVANRAGFGAPVGSGPAAANGVAEHNLRVLNAAQTHVRNTRGGTPVSDGGSIVRKTYPNARVTQTRRNPKSRLAKANSKSFHIHTNAAVDVSPIKGVTFQQFVNSFVDQGYVVLEAIDEVRAPSRHSTGPHWHIVLGDKKK